MAWLGLFTICESYIVAAVTSMYTPESVLLCAAATVAATGALALVAMTTKTDFTSVGSKVTGNSRIKSSIRIGSFQCDFLGELNQHFLCQKLIFGFDYFSGHVYSLHDLPFD